MAGASLLALLDDIATLLDDISLMTKVAAKKTAGVLGDDLALNAEQVSGVRADRELPVVWAVAKGSFVNKAILVPSALLISAFMPWAITPLLMLGGAFLCFEGVEKIAHKFLHSDEAGKAAHKKEHLDALQNAKVDLVALEKTRIKGAIRTDFILSAEIIVITLGAVQAATFLTQVSVLVAIAVLMTIGVYGLVGGIVKIDDVGLLLVKKSKENQNKVYEVLGLGLLSLAPKLMKFLSVAGTIAMFTVGGGILMHGIPGSHEVMHHLEENLHAVATVGSALAFSVPVLLNIVLGLFAGAVLVLGATVIGRIRKKL